LIYGAGGLGEKSLRSIIEMAEKVADGSLPMDAEHLRRIAGHTFNSPPIVFTFVLFLY
jgi:hypothetical protein